MRENILKPFFFFVGLITISLMVAPMQGEAQKVVVAQGTDALTLDPNMDTSSTTLNLVANMFDPLINRDSKMNFVNRLATAYKIVNPTTWRFELRRGVTFHNGEPFNAQAVKFTYERIYAPESKSAWKGMFKSISRVDIIDDYTVQIITDGPDPGLLARVTMLLIVPPKYVREIGDVKFASNPVGTGPFKFVKWIRDDQVIMERNEKYWGGPPKIKDLIFRCIPETQARMAALQTGEIDVAQNVPPDLVEKLKGKGPFGFKDTLASRVFFMALSTEDNPRYKTPLLDKRVRQAINYAIDRESITKHILLGYGENAATHLPRVLWGHHDKLKPYPYDPKRAKQLLAEAGYPNGFEIGMNGPSGRYIRDKEVCEALVNQLGQVGIRVNFKVMEWGTYLNSISSRTIAPLWFLAWSLPSMDPDQWIYPTVHSGQPYSHNNDKEIDRLIEQARNEMDQTKRKNLYYQIQELLYDRAYFAPLYDMKVLYGVSNRIDWMPRADEMLYMDDVNVSGSK